MFRDFAFALRNLRRSPGFAITAILALAAGIGANSAMFSVIDGVLLKPLPFQSPDRLVNIWEEDPQRNIPRLPAPVGNYLDWRTMNHVLSSMGAYTQTAFSLSSPTEPERYIRALSARDFFPLWVSIRLSGGRSTTRTTCPVTIMWRSSAMVCGNSASEAIPRLSDAKLS